MMRTNRSRCSSYTNLMVLLALWAAPLSVLAQDPVQTGDPYQEALTLFREGRFARAADVVQRALETGGLGEHRASGWLLLAASQIGMDAPQLALGALDGLVREYPDGPYLLETRWLRGRALLRSGRYIEAARMWTGLYEVDRDGRLGLAARDALVDLFTGEMPVADLERFGSESSGTDLKAWIVATAAGALADRGDLSRARRMLERLAEEAPTGGYTDEAADRVAAIAARLESVGPGGFVLGVLAPLTGPDERLGRDIVDAVRLAIAESDGEVRYVVRNTGGRIESTVRATLSLIEDEGAHLILGPVVDELAIIAAAMAQLADTPIILPHTQSAAPSALGDNVFQLQATMPIQARRLADTVIDSLGMATFAVLNHFSGSGPDFAEAFIARVEEKGGSIVARQQYFAETTDYMTQLETTRKAGLALSRADTGRVAIDDIEALNEANEDTLGLVPVGSIDGLMVPGANPESNQMVALQANFLNLVATLLGGPAWNNYAIISGGGDYVDGTVLTDTYSIGHTSPHQIDFANRYYATYSRQPDRSATFSYDATRLAISAWQLAADRHEDRRRSLREWLAGVEAYEGASGPVNLTREQRVNDNVYLLQIRGDRIEPLDVTRSRLTLTVPPRSR